MQHILWSKKWMKLMLTKSSLTVSSLKVHQMYKQLEQSLFHWRGACLVLVFQQSLQTIQVSLILVVVNYHR